MPEGLPHRAIAFESLRGTGFSPRRKRMLEWKIIFLIGFFYQF